MRGKRKRGRGAGGGVTSQNTLGITDMVQTIAYPTWTVSTLMAFYIMFPTILATLHTLSSLSLSLPLQIKFGLTL